MKVKVFNALGVKNICVFQAVVEHGGLTRAAKLMNRSQGQLSSIIKEIEAVCGTPLLLRTPVGVVLTEAGEVFLQASRAYVDAYNTFAFAAQRLSGRESNQVVLYAPPGGIQFLAEHVIPAFNVAHPNISLVMKACPLGEFDDYDHLLSEADLIISPQPSSHPDAVNCKVVLRLGYFVSPTYQPSTQLTHPQDLLSESCITVVNYGAKSNIWTYRENDDDRVVFVSGKYQTCDVLSAVSLARRGLGIICVPEKMVDEYVDDGSLMRVMPNWYGLKSHYIIYKKYHYVSKSVSVVRAFLLASVKDS